MTTFSIYHATATVEALGGPPIASWDEWSFEPIPESAVSNSGRWYLVHTPSPHPLLISAPAGSRLATIGGRRELVGHFKHPGMIAAVAISCARRGLHGLSVQSDVQAAVATVATPPCPVPAPSPSPDAATMARWAAERAEISPSMQPGWWRLDGGYCRRQDVIPEKWDAWDLPPHPATVVAVVAEPSPAPPTVAGPSFQQASFAFGD